MNRYTYMFGTMVLLWGCFAMAQDIDFGDDSGAWPNDGECDDPRFEGPGVSEFGIDLYADATDCRDLYDLGEALLLESPRMLEESDDLSSSGAYADRYRFTLDADTQIQVEMVSGDFDSLVRLYHEPDMSLVAEDDDGGSGVDARIIAEVDAGDYMLEATSYRAGETGAYLLTVSVLIEVAEAN